MELEKPREKSGPFLHLGKISSSLISDSFRIARLAFVHVSAAETLTEDATNTDEWGPLTKTMADIANASKNHEDRERIVQVLRARLALIGTKKWRQTFKALTVMEYLLTHGPVQFVVEFRADKERVEELSRFVYLDENMVDRGSALQSKAKQVHKLLVDEIFFRKERSRAQTVSRGILGFGSQSVASDSHTCGLKKGSPHVEGAVYDQKISTFTLNDQASSPIVQRSTNWSTLASGDDSPQMSSTSTEWNPFDESPTSSESSNSCSSSSPIAGGWVPPVRDSSPTRNLFSLESDRPDLQSPEPLAKLPPPAPKCRVLPPPPPGGSKVGSNHRRSFSAPRVLQMSSPFECR